MDEERLTICIVWALGGVLHCEKKKMSMTVQTYTEVMNGIM
jgi:hypothetical protein